MELKNVQAIAVHPTKSTSNADQIVKPNAQHWASHAVLFISFVHLAAIASMAMQDYHELANAFQ